MRQFDQARVVVDHTGQPWENELADEQVDRHDPKVINDGSLGQNTRAPACPCSICSTSKAGSGTLYRRVIFDDYDEISLDSESLTDHQYFLCFSHIYAYALQDRLWGQPYYFI